jgi:hypothetical protein
MGVDSGGDDGLSMSNEEEEEMVTEALVGVQANFRIVTPTNVVDGSGWCDNSQC